MLPPLQFISDQNSSAVYSVPGNSTHARHSSLQYIQQEDRSKGVDQIMGGSHIPNGG